MILINKYKGMLERFVRYAKVDTRSDLHSVEVPSTAKQVDFLMSLKEELKELGFCDVMYNSKTTFLTATIPSNLPEDGDEVPTIGFIAHVDTADFNSENIQPQVFYNYDGQDVVLNQEKNIVMTVKEFPHLKNYVGETLITTDGTTLLGADDKAGLVSIIQAGIYLLNHPDIKHGKVCLAFGCDEEIGKGAHRFDAASFGADFAYTLDSGEVGKLEYETFNAAGAKLVFHGTSVHPGSAYGTMVNALAEAAKFFARLPKDEVPEKTKGYDGFYMLSQQKGDIGEVRATYIIRDHSKEKFLERKANFLALVEEQNNTYDYPRIDCTILDQYYNMYDILKEDMTSVDLAKEAYQACGIEPVINPFRGGTDGCIITFKGIPTPNLFTGAENLHGQYEFVTLESMQKASDVILKIIELTINKYYSIESYYY